MKRVFLAVSLLISYGVVFAQGAKPEELYKKHCMVCHGEQGKGDGQAAYLLFPKPRDFTKGLFKIRSTATGEMPTDDDLFNTLTRGIPGSAMPSFSYLSEAERKELIAYIKKLTVADIEGERVNFFELRGEVQPVKVGAPPAQTPDIIAKGKAVFQKMSCAKCHGDDGKGEGTSAKDLKDDWGYPIPPNNFTRGIYKGGSDVKDIYMRFTTGLNGTPMPSFADQLTEDERWQLAYYVKSLEVKGHPAITKQASEEAVNVKKVDKIIDNPKDPRWQDISGTTFPLMHLWQRKEAIDFFTVKAVHDGSDIAVYLEWEDATLNGATLSPQDFTDAAAVMFALTAVRGHFSMGEPGKPCNIWHWRFDKQLDVERFRDMEDKYTGMVADDYQFEKTRYPKTMENAGQQPITSAPSHDQAYISGWAAGNSMSNPNRKSPIENLVAVGFGTLQAQPQEYQNVKGEGVWENGKWKVVFIRSLKGSGENNVKLEPGVLSYIAFAIWDGSVGERDGQKSVTYWQNLVLEK